MTDNVLDFGGYHTQLKRLSALVAQAESLHKQLSDVDVSHFGRVSCDGSNMMYIADLLTEAKVLVRCCVPKMRLALREAVAIKADGDLFVPAFVPAEPMDH